MLSLGTFTKYVNDETFHINLAHCPGDHVSCVHENMDRAALSTHCHPCTYNGEAYPCRLVEMYDKVKHCLFGGARTSSGL